MCLQPSVALFLLFFFFNDTATTEIYTLSLHDALPISSLRTPEGTSTCPCSTRSLQTDRKSTRLNSSHHSISYAVFCLKKKKEKIQGEVKKRKEEDESCRGSNGTGM